MIERLKNLPALVWITLVVPTFLAVLYFGVLAQDIYISEARIIVRNPDTTPPGAFDLALNQTGFGAASQGNDAVIAYLRSRQAIDEGNQDGLFTAAYSRDDIFWLDRFGALGGTSNEQFYRYFQDWLSVEEGNSTQVLTIRVSAFDPVEAQAINRRLVAQSEALVNSLSERAQADLVAIAEAEVDNALEEARKAAVQLARFRDQSGIVDPAQESEIGLQMISKLQDELISAQTRLRQLRTYTPEATQIPYLQTQIRELESEIASARGELTGGRASLSAALATYQELQINAQFAESQLAATRASLQEARAEARRKQTYLEEISAPSLPDYPMEPRRLRSIIAAILLGILAWGIASMLAIGIREHRD